MYVILKENKSKANNFPDLTYPASVDFPRLQRSADRWASLPLSTCDLRIKSKEKKNKKYLFKI